MEYRFLFGPVYSGRLGLSLGVDLLGDTICSFDCIYCEVGTTTQHTCQRGPYVSADTIIGELREWKGQAKKLPDHVTLAGKGEPCLNSELGDIIVAAGKIFSPVPVAVLTNSSLLHQAAVRRDLLRADVILPSLDTLVASEMKLLNRPYGGLCDSGACRDTWGQDTRGQDRSCEQSCIDRMTSGLLALRQEFCGKIYLEILLLAGINDTQENLEELKKFIPLLQPDRVDVCTLSRPGSLHSARAVSAEVLDYFSRQLGAVDSVLPCRDVEEKALCRADDEAGAEKKTSGPGRTDRPTEPAEPDRPAGPDAVPEVLLHRIHNSVARRPQTSTQLSAALGQPEELVEAALAVLVAQGRTGQGRQAGQLYYGDIWKEEQRQ